MKHYLIRPLLLTILSLFTQTPTITALPFASHEQKPVFNAHTITNNTVNITIDQRQTSAIENVLAAQQRAPEAPDQEKRGSGTVVFIKTLLVSSLVIAGDLAYEAFWNSIDF